MSTQNMWSCTRWNNGCRITGDGDSDTARQLYRGATWYGTLTGMVDETEKQIVNALNKSAALEAELADVNAFIAKRARVRVGVHAVWLREKDRRMAAEADRLELLTAARHLIRAQLADTSDDQGPYLTAFAELQEAVAQVEAQRP